MSGDETVVDLLAALGSQLCDKWPGAVALFEYALQADNADIRIGATYALEWFGSAALPLLDQAAAVESVPFVAALQRRIAAELRVVSDREMPPPGPERDALVAELVFGWTLCPENCNRDWPHRHGEDEDGPYMESVYQWSWDDKWSVDVLLEMQRLGFAADVYTSTGERWEVEFWRDSEPDHGEGAFAAAVTEAAIRARWAEQEAVA